MTRATCHRQNSSESRPAISRPGLEPQQPAPPEPEQPGVGGVEERGDELLRPRQEQPPPVPGEAPSGEVVERELGRVQGPLETGLSRQESEFSRPLGGPETTSDG
jgi:hypothetical protein